MADRTAVPHGGLLGRQLSMPSRVDEITDRLVTAIAIGEYLPGARLPVERELASSLGVGRMTVRAALARLVERGLLETRRGRGGGSYVVDQWPESSTDAVRRTPTMRLDELRDRCDADLPSARRGVGPPPRRGPRRMWPSCGTRRSSTARRPAVWRPSRPTAGCT
jgi:DNA-binding transcriptional regulator YhcF (GntR family)